ncbi:MAG: hypothetical protein FJ352_01120 [Firmicutes bacterium]|nr:hypothetical protein [Bacillota bacterium]
MGAKQIYLKIQQALSSTSQKYVTAEMLSQSIGIYPDVINEALSMFNPVVTLDVTFNLLELLPDLNQYLGNAKLVTMKRNRSVQKSLPYTSFAEFVYQKMTMAGIVDKSIQLSDKDLKLAKKLIQNELKSRKK